MNVAGVVAALAAEARALGPVRRRSDALSSLADGTLVAVSGMGSAAAAHGARRLIEAGARGLVSWGMAGGLDPALRAGCVFLPGEIVGADGECFATARHWRDALGADIAALRPQAGGRLLTSARAIATVADKAAAFARTGAAAVDMESLAVARIAADHGVPFIAVRVIVDTAHDVLPRSVVAASHAGQVRMGRLLRGLVASPADVAGLIRLARRYRAARRSMGAIARTGALARLAFAATPAAAGRP